MSKYNHEKAPNQRAAQFILWCRDNVKEWPKNAAALAIFTGNKFSNYSERRHYKSLCYSWSVCTKAQWLTQPEVE